MENRWSERSVVGLEAIILQNDIPTIKCKTENVCIEGVTLKLAPSVNSSGISQQVELSFFGDNQINNKPIPAKLVHTSSQHVGLMFNILDDVVLRDIKKVLYQAGAYEHSN